MLAGSAPASPAGGDDRVEVHRRILRTDSVPGVCAGDGRAPVWWRSAAPSRRSFRPELLAPPVEAASLVSL